jgi:hypothetical protein
MGWELGLALVTVVGFSAWALFRLYAIIRTKSGASWAPKVLPFPSLPSGAHTSTSIFHLFMLD